MDQYKRPREIMSRDLLRLSTVWLWDGLESANCQASRIRLVERYTSTDELGDKGVSVATDPYVSSLINSQGATGVQISWIFLKSCGR